jgi:hypothetical protein
MLRDRAASRKLSQCRGCGIRLPSRIIEQYTSERPVAAASSETGTVLNPGRILCVNTPGSGRSPVRS